MKKLKYKCPLAKRNERDENSWAAGVISEKQFHTEDENGKD